MEGALQQRPNTKSLIVGFDFGTTFSGVAWTVFNSNIRHLRDADMRTVRAWPSSHGPDQDESKVPSRLYYNSQGEVTRWGYEAAEVDAIIMEWFKLAIVPEKDLPSHLRSSAKLKATKKQMKDLGLKPTQVISEYIQRIWAHAEGEIQKSIGERDFKTMPLHVVFTVPAIWGNSQNKEMRNAASRSILQGRNAAITTFSFLSEPEAAVQAYARELQTKLGMDETVVVPDLGGGTGDVISYLKVGESEEACMEVKEAAPGVGALCGAMFVDEAFEELVLGRLPARHKDLKTENPAAWRRIMTEQWQAKIKRSFVWKGTGHLWPVILSNVTPNDDVVHLHEDEIRKVFEGSVMPRIIDLVKKQVEQVKKTNGGKAPVVILPVGGFGRCPYVLQRLRDEFEGVGLPGKSGKKPLRKKQRLDFQKIEVHSETGEVPWTAVCRGACVHGLREQLDLRLVKSRLSRVSLGFIENAPGSAEDGGVWNPNFADFMIQNKVTYVVRKGDPIDTAKNSQMAMFFAFDLSAKGMHCEKATFYAYDSDTPPARWKQNDSGFRDYGVMEIKVPIPIQKLRKEDNNAWTRRVFDYYLKIETVGGSVQVVATDTDGNVLGELVLPNLDGDEPGTV
ncbi:hypothetical protein DHEL01_v209713 [Diaporthe helianthi]|uniref:Hsp70-like protein n=1 Tax=Diaporthe helianthi TaxID=158607 RepID=A0A2P5HNQ3_DIAHE|nr:hypothetical protein DHEL01_v209713 [Diaporthe helianthi]